MMEMQAVAKLAAFLAVVSSLVVHAAGCSAPKQVARVPTDERAHVKVMTYNVNYGLAGDPDTLAAIGEPWADIVLLQETTEVWEAAIVAALGERYPHRAFRHCCGAGGLAVLSRYPWTEEEVLEPESGWFPAWRLVVDTPLGPLQILNVHLRPPVSDSGSVVSGYFSTPPIREQEMAGFAAALDPDLPTLVVGDFNENDSGRAIAVLRAAGFATALPKFDVPQRTWRWTTSMGTVTSQLDHIVHDPRLEPLDVRALPLGRSDHLPVVGIFELERRQPADSSGSTSP